MNVSGLSFSRCMCLRFQGKLVSCLDLGKECRKSIENKCSTWQWLLVDWIGMRCSEARDQPLLWDHPQDAQGFTRNVNLLKQIEKAMHAAQSFSLCECVQSLDRLIVFAWTWFVFSVPPLGDCREVWAILDPESGQRILWFALARARGFECNFGGVVWWVHTSAAKVFTFLTSHFPLPFETDLVWLW